MSCKRLGRHFSVALLTCLSGCGIAVPSGHPIKDYKPVFAAATAGDLAAVRNALDSNPDLVRTTEWNRATLLHDAVGHNEEAVAAFLLTRRADVNAVTADGLTPLHLAAQNGNVRIIQLLLQRGANLDAVDGRGWTALDRAVKWHHSDAAELLRSRSACHPATASRAASKEACPDGRTRRGGAPRADGR